MGITDEEFYEAIIEFSGASKRMEALIVNGDLKVYRDFAHAPSKVKASVRACQETYAESNIWAILELHTFSSLNIEFMQQYAGSMDPAQKAIVYFNPEVLQHKKLPALDAAEVQAAFKRDDLLVIQNSEELALTLQKGKSAGNVFLLMSSGNFDGIDWPEVFS